MPGPNLCLDARGVEVITQDPSPELRERACNALRQRGIAAVPYHSGPELLVSIHKQVPEEAICEDDCRVDLKDSGKIRKLRFVDTKDKDLLTKLIERCLIIEIGRRTDMWRLDSPRIWYMPKPFMTIDDIAAYRRFEISAIPIESVGVGIVIDVGTAFFTVSTIADFFRKDVSEMEQKQLRKQFEFLSKRQHGQKGSLLYDLGHKKGKCYFIECLPDTTCATTGILRVKGHDYPSLLDYYHQKYPSLSVKADDTVARVSFPTLDRPQKVAANKLHLRVMNKSLPKDLKQVDKITPKDRRNLIEEFWAGLGEDPLGQEMPTVAAQLWQPASDKIMNIKPPNLLFARDQILSSPSNGNLERYKEYFHKRSPLIREAGCFIVPSAVTRTIYYAVPDKTNNTMAIKLAEDITTHISGWTRVSMDPKIISYRNLEDAFSQLNREKQPGMVVFVFEDDDPATYFMVSYELKRWRVKRITYKIFLYKFRRGGSKWQSFTEMCALDVLQQLDCIPWTIEGPLHYESQLAIDVGKDHRYFALSLLKCLPQPAVPSFWIGTSVELKPDPKLETINEIFLRDKIIELFMRLEQLQRAPLRSALILRDGRKSGRESEGIYAAKEELIRRGMLNKDVRMDIVDIHKHTVKGIRIWDFISESDVRHALEGKALFLDDATVIVTNTGAATLRQGTADPLMLVARGEGINMVHVVEDVHTTTHLNYSSPGTAQRLPLVLKRTDDELESRAAQEIRRIR